MPPIYAAVSNAIPTTVPTRIHRHLQLLLSLTLFQLTLFCSCSLFKISFFLCLKHGLQSDGVWYWATANAFLSCKGSTIALSWLLSSFGFSSSIFTLNYEFGSVLRICLALRKCIGWESAAFNGNCAKWTFTRNWWAEKENNLNFLWVFLFLTEFMQWKPSWILGPPYVCRFLI